MPSIFISTKLSNLIGKSRLSLFDKSHLSSKDDWNAQLFTVDRRKCIIITNKATLYSAVRLDILKRDLSDLKLFFIDALLNQLKSDQLYSNKGEGYLSDNLAKLIFTTTDNDKKVIGSMNDMIYQLKVGIQHRVPDLLNPTDINAAKYVNSIPMSLIQFKCPLQKMHDLQNNA